MRTPALGRVPFPRLLFLLAVGAGAGIGCQPAAKEAAQPPPVLAATVTVVPAASGPIAASFEIVGSVQPVEQAKIAPTGAGRIARALRKQGDAVKAGQLLFVLDLEPTQAAGSREGAGTAAKRAAKKRAEIRSPLAGVLFARFSNPGDRVTATPPTLMALVADLDLMKLTAPLPEAHVAEVQPGQEVTVTADALPGRGFGGRVDAVAPGDAVGAAAVEILVNNAGHSLTPGAFARARVFTAFRPRTILVPPAALDGDRVRVVESGVARVRTVVAGVRTAEAVEILSGVAPGDLVVVSGGDGLGDGARVTCEAP